MAIVIGVDIGTTTLTALALDAATGDVAACETVANDAEITSAADKARGRSEWDVARIVHQTTQALAAVSGRLGQQAGAVAGLAFTGQQHGVVLLDAGLRPVTPLINWQDRRGEELVPGGGRTWVAEATARARPETRRTGCRFATGFMGVTLFWMRETGLLPSGALACFAADAVAAALTGERPRTDPTHAASSGLLDIVSRDWDRDLQAALDLPAALFPEVAEAGEPLGRLTPDAARATGLPPGTPIFVGLGDNQASFLGSVAAPEETLLVNVGTGAQVAVYSDHPAHVPPAETRPFPRGGYLLVHAGLCGGRSYALLERFFRQVAEQILGIPVDAPLYERMNELAAQAPPGADGLRCHPVFAGSREDPLLRGTWSGVSTGNFTPAHWARSLLEGIARALHEGADGICRARSAPCRLLVGAGNGLRRNPVLAGIVASEFGAPLAFPRHREEAAFGAALVAAYGAGLFPDLASAARLIRYEDALPPARGAHGEGAPA